MMSPPTTETRSDDDGRGASDDSRGGARVLEDLVGPVLDAVGFELVHLEWAQSGRRRVMRVFMDHPDGVTLDDCSRLSPMISNALDAAEAAPGSTVAAILQQSYVLEVSSPGIERPLSRRRHFERYTGQQAAVRTVVPLQPGQNQRGFHGRIEAVEPDPHRPDDDRAGTVVLRAADTGEAHRIPISQIRRAHLVSEV